MRFSLPDAIKAPSQTAAIAFSSPGAPSTMRKAGRCRPRSTRSSTSRPGSLSVTTTDALFAGKVQRKVSHGIAGLAAAGSSRHRQKIAAIPASASILPRSWHSARAAPPTVAARTRIVSAAGIRLDHRKSVRPFKGIICNDISEFESYMPSHAVGLHVPVLFGTCHHISQGGAAPDGRPAAFMPAPVTRTTFLESSLSLQRQPASVSAIAYSISSMSSGTRTPAVMAKAPRACSVGDSAT